MQTLELYPTNSGIYTFIWLSSCINLEIPYQYPSSSTNLSETKNIPVHICTLCDKNHFMNIITYPQHQTSTVFADLSFTSSSSSSIFTCSKRFINILCDIENEDIRCDPDLVRLCSLPNGLVYAIWYTTMNKKLHCSVAFPLSCCKPIVTWAFIRNPAANSTLSRIIDNTLADNRCTQIENNTVNDLLIGLTKDGEGVGKFCGYTDRHKATHNTQTVLDICVRHGLELLNSVHPGPYT
ncbi:unnamed protein product [Schistosoma curassoni]|uniref:SPARK domain-containing protein n=1 Tax=Schistosoma curassoni TaxID=6186 RepID=A0A183JQ65_9TREM|nr:unnamed protein product [Schistosoma curassoni]